MTILDVFSGSCHGKVLSVFSTKNQCSGEDLSHPAIQIPTPGFGSKSSN